jgi:hypothetical protein
MGNWCLVAAVVLDEILHLTGYQDPSAVKQTGKALKQAFLKGER